MITLHLQTIGTKELQNGNYFCLSEYQSMKRRVLKFWNDHDFAFYDKEIDIM